MTQILAGMKGASKLAENWLRAAVETVAERERKAGGKLPVADGTSLYQLIILSAFSNSQQNDFEFDQSLH